MKIHRDKLASQLQQRDNAILDLHVIFNRCLQHLDHPYTVQELDITFRNLLKNPETSGIIKKIDHAEMVAWLCVARVELADQGQIHPEEYHMGDMLRLLVGTQVDAKHWKNQEALVNYLYGPAVWAVYRNDVDSNALFPGYLWKLKLPLKGLATLGIEAESRELGLPGDMIG